MLKYLVASMALVLVAFGAAPKAEAAGIPIVWGANDNFDKVAAVTVPPAFLQKYPVEWADGKAELAHHSETFAIFWIAGLWVTDKGFSVHVPGTNEHWPVTDADIAEFQADGIIPANLGGKDIPITTWLMGFLGWIIVIALVLLGVAASARKKAA